MAVAETEKIPELVTGRFCNRIPVSDVKFSDSERYDTTNLSFFR